MSDKEKEVLEEDEDVIIEMMEEEEHAHSCGCGCGEHDEDVLIAKIVMGESGEEEYIEPTDEEFDAVQRAYDALMDEEEDD